MNSEKLTAPEKASLKSFESPRKPHPKRKDSHRDYASQVLRGSKKQHLTSGMTVTSIRW